MEGAFTLFVSILHGRISEQNAPNKIHSHTISQQDTLAKKYQYFKLQFI